MPVRIRYRVEVAVSSTTAEERDLVNAQYEVVSDDFGEGGVRKFTLPTGSVDQPVDIGNIEEARFIAIRTNAKDPLNDPNEICIKRNTTSNEEIEIRPMDNTKEGHFLLSTSGLTAVFASNPGSVDMEMTVITAGD